MSFTLAAGWNRTPWIARLTCLASQALSNVDERHEHQVPDVVLVWQARQGEPRALQEIYLRHAAAVYRRLTHLLGPDPEREDLMQEVFADLFRQIGSYRGEAGLRTYLFRIAINKSCDHLRTRQRRGESIGSDCTLSEEGTMEFCSPTPSPEERVGDRQELALVFRALDKLTPKKRIAFLLRVVEGLSLKEISEQVGASVATVAQRIRHADREIHLLVEQARRRQP